MKKIKLLCVSALALATICAATLTVSAEGSRELTANGGYRPQLEWHTTGTNAGITRTSTIKVFARAGEVIKFGSSVYNSSADCDIAVYNPSGTRLTYDIIQNAEGHIVSPANEKTGAYPELGGIDSSNGVLAYKNNYGDQKGYDFRTYSP